MMLSLLILLYENQCATYRAFGHTGLLNFFACADYSISAGWTVYNMFLTKKDYHAEYQV